MLVQRKNPKGGRPLSKPQVTRDPKTSVMGYKFDYCPRCAEPLIIPFHDLEWVVNEFAWALSEEKPTLRERLAAWLRAKADRLSARPVKTAEDLQVESIQMRAMQEQYRQGDY